MGKKVWISNVLECPVNIKKTCLTLLVGSDFQSNNIEGGRHKPKNKKEYLWAENKWLCLLGEPDTPVSRVSVNTFWIRTMNTALLLFPIGRSRLENSTHTYRARKWKLNYYQDHFQSDKYIWNAWDDKGTQTVLPINERNKGNTFVKCLRCAR